MPVLGLILLLAAPQKGIIPLDIVSVGRLEIAPSGGTPEEALALWIAGHKLQKEGKLGEACGKYVAFLGMAGHRSLPVRYAEMARDRVEELHDPVRKKFEAACRAYESDRAVGLTQWKSLASEWSMLPEGDAAEQLWQSDALREAIDVAKRLRDDGKKKEAAGPLEKAVRALPRGLYRYEATALLLELGGPDLRPEKWRDDDAKGTDPAAPKKKSEDGDSEIEIND